MGDSSRPHGGPSSRRASSSHSSTTHGHHNNEMVDGNNMTAHNYPSFMNPGEGSFFHRSQQSGKMQFDMKRRSRLLHEQRRKAHIEMAKKMEGVEDKKMPMYTLSQDTVTLCMEISHADHIEIIMDRNGLGDEDSESVSKILVETETLIQFPDREDNGHDLLPSQQQARAAQAKENSQFVNQVTITGPLHNVNEARIRLRSLCPLTVCFPVVNTRPELPVSTLTDWLIRSKENGTLPFPKLKIQVLPPSVSYIYTPVLNTGPQAGQAAGPAIRVTGRMCDEDEVLRACETLRELLFDPSVASEIVFSSHVYIPSSHWKVVVGDPEGSLMVLVSKLTAAHIHFPEKAEQLTHSTGFFCTGQAGPVITARRFIQGLLPLQLCFDVDDRNLVHPVEDVTHRDLCIYDEGTHVTLKLQRSDTEPEELLPGESMRHFVQLITCEANAGALFAAYRRSLRDGMRGARIECTDYDFMRDLRPNIGQYVRRIDIPCVIAPKQDPECFQLKSESGSCPPSPLIATACDIDAASHVHPYNGPLVMAANTTGSVIFDDYRGNTHEFDHSLNTSLLSERGERGEYINITRERHPRFEREIPSHGPHHHPHHHHHRYNGPREREGPRPFRNNYNGERKFGGRRGSFNPRSFYPLRQYRPQSEVAEFMGIGAQPQITQPVPQRHYYHVHPPQQHSSTNQTSFEEGDSKGDIAGLGDDVDSSSCATGSVNTTVDENIPLDRGSIHLSTSSSPGPTGGEERGDSRRMPFRPRYLGQQQQYDNQSQYMGRRHVDSARSSRLGDRDFRPGKVELQYRAPAQRLNEQPQQQQQQQHTEEGGDRERERMYKKEMVEKQENNGFRDHQFTRTRPPPPSLISSSLRFHDGRALSALPSVVTSSMNASSTMTSLTSTMAAGASSLPSLTTTNVPPPPMPQQMGSKREIQQSGMMNSVKQQQQMEQQEKSLSVQQQQSQQDDSNGQMMNNTYTRSYADIARRINAFDLIKLASLDPQSVEHNSEMRKIEGGVCRENGEGVDRQRQLERERESREAAATYAHVVEGRRTSASSWSSVVDPSSPSNPAWSTSPENGGTTVQKRPLLGATPYACLTSPSSPHSLSHPSSTRMLSSSPSSVAPSSSNRLHSPHPSAPSFPLGSYILERMVSELRNVDYANGMMQSQQQHPNKSSSLPPHLSSSTVVRRQQHQPPVHHPLPQPPTNRYGVQQPSE